MKFDRTQFFTQIRPIVAVPGVGIIEYQVEGINRLLSFIEADSRWDEMDSDVAIRTLAYFLATVAHECTIKMNVGGKSLYVKSFQPVEEMGGTAYLNRMYDTRTDLGNSRAADGDGAKFAGDGYVQNTGGKNARTTGRRLAGTVISFEDIPSDKHDILAAFAREGGSARTPITVDASTFVREHELLRVPKISYEDAIDGMLTGRYTGKKISDYINEDENDTFNARRVINGITAKNRPRVVEIADMAAKFGRALRGSRIEGSPADAEIAGLSSSEVQTTSPESPLPETQLPDNGPAPQSTSAEAFTAYIPNIDSAKGWIRKAFGGSILGTIFAFIVGAPLWVQIAAVVIVVTIIVSAAVILVKYHKQVFTLVAQLNTVRAQPETANFNIAPHN